MNCDDWIDCSEQAPLRDGIYMAWHDQAESDKAWPALFEGGRWYSASGEVRASVTHWQPMPSQPGSP